MNALCAEWKWSKANGIQKSHRNFNSSQGKIQIVDSRMILSFENCQDILPNWNFSVLKMAVLFETILFPFLVTIFFESHNLWFYATTNNRDQSSRNHQYGFPANTRSNLPSMRKLAIVITKVIFFLRLFFSQESSAAPVLHTFLTSF